MLSGVCGVRLLSRCWCLGVVCLSLDWCWWGLLDWAIVPFGSLLVVLYRFGSCVVEWIVVICLCFGFSDGAVRWVGGKIGIMGKTWSCIWLRYCDSLVGDVSTWVYFGGGYDRVFFASLRFGVCSLCILVGGMILCFRAFLYWWFVCVWLLNFG